MTDANRPLPPDGYSSWLEYAVARMDTRTPELEASFENLADEVEGKGGVPREIASRLEMHQAVWAEFNALRQKAGLPAVEPRWPVGPARVAGSETDDSVG